MHNHKVNPAAPSAPLPCPLQVDKANKAATITLPVDKSCKGCVRFGLDKQTKNDTPSPIDNIYIGRDFAEMLGLPVMPRVIELTVRVLN